MPTADAAVLHVESELDPESARRLDAVGVEAILGAMIEQKRRSDRPSAPALPALEDAEDPDEAPATLRAPSRSEVFVKAR